MFNAVTLDSALTLLGQLLQDRGERFEVVAIGGGSLLLIGLIDRPTKDLDLVALREGDVLAPAGRPLPAALAEAVEDVARVLDLPPNWMNGGPDSLLRFGLPAGELRAAARWTRTHDSSEGFATMLAGVLRSFGLDEEDAS